MADTMVERLTEVATVPAGPLPPDAQVAVLVNASTLAGNDDEPGHLVGVGPIPAPAARTLAAAPTSTCRRAVCEDGQAQTLDRRAQPRSNPDLSVTERLAILVRAVLAVPADDTVRRIDSDARYYTGLLRRFLHVRDGGCRMPVCHAPIRDDDHIHPYASGGRTSSSNGHGLSRRCHHLRDLPGWHVAGNGDSDSDSDVVWTMPTGHRYLSRPPPALGWGPPSDCTARGTASWNRVAAISPATMSDSWAVSQVRVRLAHVPTRVALGASGLLDGPCVTRNLNPARACRR